MGLVQCIEFLALMLGVSGIENPYIKKSPLLYSRNLYIDSSDIKACFIFVVGSPELEVLSIQGLQSWFICHACTHFLPHSDLIAM